MKQNLRVSVSNKPQENGMVSCKSISLRERFMRKLFGKEQKVVVLVPGEAIDELCITKTMEGGRI